MMEIIIKEHYMYSVSQCNNCFACALCDLDTGTLLIFTALVGFEYNFQQITALEFFSWKPLTVSGQQLCCYSGMCCSLHLIWSQWENFASTFSCILGTMVDCVNVNPSEHGG